MIITEKDKDTPIMHFLGIDEAARMFKGTSVSIFFKIDALNNLFKLSTHIVDKQYHAELFKIVPYAMLRPVNKGLEDLAQCYKDAEFFDDLYEGIKKMQRDMDFHIVYFIEHHVELNALLNAVSSFVNVISKYSFEERFLPLAKKRKKKSILFQPERHYFQKEIPLT